MKVEKKTIKFEYKILPSYNIYPINGAFGGVNPQGEIITNFFHERHAIPKSQTYKIKKDGSLENNPIEEIKNDAIIRNVLFGISMNPITAKSIAKWLVEKANYYDTIFKPKK